MPLLRRLALLATVTAGFAVLSGPALAAGTPDGTLPFQLDSTNFRVHYQSDTGPGAPASAITETQAGDIAALAERALAAELADGYARPLSDGVLGGDGRIDIYVEDYTSLPGVLASARWDTDALTTSGYIELAGNDPPDAFTEHTIAHELFHLIQFGTWLPRHAWAPPSSASDLWLLEASAEWMGFRVDGYPAVDAGGLGPSDMALDCRDPLGGTSNKCDLTDDYLGNGYSRWPFFEYLSEKYGPAFVNDIFAQGFAGDPDGLTAIGAVAAALASKGTTLADTYNAWARAEVSSSYSIASLKAVKPKPYGAPIFTGVISGPVTAQKVPVNHLSTRFLQFVRGRSIGGSPASVCWKATLSISVTIPARTLSQPVFYWDGAGKPDRAALRQRQQGHGVDPVGHLHLGERRRIPRAPEYLAERRRGRLRRQRHDRRRLDDAGDVRPPRDAAAARDGHLTRHPRLVGRRRPHDRGLRAAAAQALRH